MSSADYMPLVERIRGKLNSWTARFLSYAGRLQLLNSVIASIINFWTTAYRLPSGCVKELDKLCSAFLWSGPELNTKKAKIAWKDVCKPREEGGLGLRAIKETNKVSCLKLLWHIISFQPTLWVRWMCCNYLQRATLWTVNARSTQGSWMWKKLLKYRDLAKTFVRVEVRNGKNTSFWFDAWSSLGCLFDKTGHRGVIDMGISTHATVALVLNSRRPRNHRVEVLNKIEAEIVRLRQRMHEDDDRILWKTVNNQYLKRFSTMRTWKMTRPSYDRKEWYRGVWFPYATPKYSFFCLACLS